VPLGVEGRVFGVLALSWPDERDFTDDDGTTIAALASFTASAVQRALLLQERVETAMILQSALLTTLPQVSGLDLAAREQVGGDWYDALVMHDGATARVIGDVVGHDMKAAADMGAPRGRGGDGSGSTLLSITDGLVERRGEDIDDVAVLAVRLV
jgi:serine phosphatase RsbU (regulator of sigma subunit)